MSVTDTAGGGAVPTLRFPEFEGAWMPHELGELVSLQSGFAFSSELFGDTGQKLVTPKNFTKTGKGHFNETNTKFTTEVVDEKFICSEGDLLALLTDLTPTCELLGKPLELTSSDGAVLLNQRIVRIENDINRLEKGFLKAFMLRNDFHVRMFSTASGTTVRHSSNKVLRDTPITLPSLPEQKEIARFLGVVDAKIAALQERRAGLERYKRGLMQALFSQRLRFTKPDGSAFPDWEEKRLGDVAKIYDGTHQTPNYVARGVPFFSVEHVTANQFAKTKFITEEVFEKESKRVVLKRDDILMTRIGDIGTCRIIDWDVRASFYVSLALLKCSMVVVPSYLSQFMAAAGFQRELWKRTIHVAFPKKINLGEIGNCQIQLPHPDEQRKIADALGAMDAKIKSVAERVAKLEAFKKGLLQQMFV